MEAAILILLMLACAAFIYHFTFAEAQAHRNKVNRKRFDIIDKCQQNGETSVYLNDLKNADKITQIETAIANYLDWKYKK